MGALRAALSTNQGRLVAQVGRYNRRVALNFSRWTLGDLLAKVHDHHPIGYVPVSYTHLTLPTNREE